MIYVQFDTIVRALIALMVCGLLCLMSILLRCVSDMNVKESVILSTFIFTVCGSAVYLISNNVKIV